MYVNLKKFANELKGPLSKAGVVFSAGVIIDRYHEIHDTSSQFIEWAITFYWIHSKEPMAGFQVFRNQPNISSDVPFRLVLWHTEQGTTVRVKPRGTEYFPVSRYLVKYDSGIYDFESFANGIYYVCSTVE